MFALVTIVCASVGSYEYYHVPSPKMGSTLYAFSKAGQRIFAQTDWSACREYATSETGEAVIAAGRAVQLEEGTALRILSMRDNICMLKMRDNIYLKIPFYRVHVINGKHAGKTLYICSLCVCGRRTVPDKPTKKRH